MDKRFWAIILIVLLVFGGLFIAEQKDKKQVITGTTNHVIGKLDSSVTLTEYGDYQCNACQSFAPTTNTLRQKYADRVKFQFRNLPLTQIHPNAFAAARAAEAADIQGKFWEMHDALYETSRWTVWTNAKDPTPEFKRYAKELGLDVTKFSIDMKSEAVNKRINADVDAFNATKTEPATPAFFLNGKRLSNGDFLDSKNQADLNAMSKVLDKALAEKK